MDSLASESWVGELRRLLFNYIELGWGAEEKGSLASESWGGELRRWTL